jgi:signal transduction histidine kinase
MFRLLRSSAFRLTLLYMVTFGASVTALLIFVYTAIISDMEDDLKHAIGVQVADLRRKFIVSGVNETAASIQNLLRKDEEQTLVLMLIDPKWHIVVGNLATWPGGKIHTPTWIKLPIGKAEGANPPPQAIALNSTLPGGYILLVGRKMDRIEHVHEIIVEVLYICFGVMFALAAAGGMLLSYTIYRRVDVINQAFRRVAGGQLSARVKVTGTGDEFDHLAVHLNRTLDRIGELIEGVRDISYSVAHDLRTPLSRLRHRLERLLATDVDREHMTTEVRTALTEIDTVVATFNAILRIAQAEMGAGVEQFGAFDLSEAVLDVTDLYRPVAEETAHSFITNIAPDIILTGDRHLITQAFANVLDNAIKYTPAGGEVSVTLSAGPSYAELRVSDNGPGIPAALYPKVTEKFFRLERSRSSPGNGLGLSLVSAAVKLHKGDLQFADNASGLIVIIRLPHSPGKTPLPAVI